MSPCLLCRAFARGYLRAPPSQVDPFICIYNENNAQGCVDVNNPWYSPSGAVNSDAWYSIYVPVQDFGTAFGATNKINQVRFGHNQVRTQSTRGCRL